MLHWTTSTLGAWTLCPGTRCTRPAGHNVYKLSLEYPHPNLSTVPVSKYKVETLYPGAVVSTLFVSSEAVSRNYNWQQNELRHFAQNLAFLSFTDFKRRKYCFSSPIPSMQCCANVRATYRKQQSPQL